MQNSQLSPFFIFIIGLLYFAVPAHASPFIKQKDNLIILPSPDKETIKDLPIIAYRGLPVLGAYSLQPKLTRQQLGRLRGDSALIFSNLMRIKLASTPPNKARLKENFNGKQQAMFNQGSAGDVLEDRQWYALIAKLAPIAMTDKAYVKYMCKDDPCTKNDLKSKNQGFMMNWGGLGANQFAARRAFHGFIDNELDKFLSWAKQLDPEPEAYMVGRTQLSPYLFDKGGFAVRINRVSGTLIPTTGENLNNSFPFSARIEGKRIAGALVKINESDAEKIVERVKGKQLYYVYKAKLKVAKQSYDQQTKQLNFNRLLFDQTITSDVIEVFIGPELQDKLFDIPL